MIVNFSLVCEGSSDSALVEYIKTTLIECGATQASGDCPNFSLLRDRVGCDIKSKVEAALKLNNSINMLFVHRDIDSSSRSNRNQEIKEGTQNVPTSIAIVPILPNKMLEAWLLVDENLIKIAAENRNYQGELNLPRLKQIERISDPKTLLFNKIRQASEKTGRRLEKFSLYEARRYIVQNIDHNGPIRHLESHKHFISDIKQAIQSLYDQ